MYNINERGKYMDIIIRGIDDAAASRLTQLAKKKGISRESYIRMYLESLAVLDDMKQLDYKYEGLVKEMAAVIENNTNELKSVMETVNSLKENISITSSGKDDL